MNDETDAPPEPESTPLPPNETDTPPVEEGERYDGGEIPAAEPEADPENEDEVG